jgi:hypothetical protein
MQKLNDYFTQAIKKFFNTLEKHRTIFFLLISLIVLGGFVRSFNILWGNEIIYFEGDDFYHYMWSGFNEPNYSISNNLLDVFYGSYHDAHPPMRNLTLNLLLRSISDLTQSRLITFIPGLILIPFSCVFGFIVSDKANKTNRLFIGLFFAFIVTIMQELIYLSIGTRPYMLMINFQLASLLALIIFFRNNKLISFLIFLLFATLSSLTVYSANIVIGTYCIVLIIYILNVKPKFHIRKIILIYTGLIFLAGLTFFQFNELKQKHALTWLINLKTNTPNNDYISKYYLSSLKEIPNKFANYFEIFFEKSPMKSKMIYSILSLAYLLGVILLIKKRSFEKAALALLPFLVIIVCAFANILPFSPNRHSLVLLPSVFIAYSELLERILQTRFKFFIPLLALFYLISANLFPSSGNYLSRFIEHESNKYGFSTLNKNDYDFIFEKLNHSIAENQLIIIDENTANRLELFTALENLNSLIKHEKHKRQEYNSLKRGVNFCAFDIYGNSKITECNLLSGGKIGNYKSIIVLHYNAILKEFPNMNKSIRELPKELGFNKEINIQNSDKWFLSTFIK